MTSAEDVPHIEVVRGSLGAVLAGGQSRRVGRDKAMIPFFGQPLIQHVCKVLEEVFTEVVIVCGPTRSYDFLGLPVLTDLVSNSGPLGGIYTALKHSSDRAAFVVACDLPYINRDLVEYVLNFPSATALERKNFSTPTPALAKFPIQDRVRQPLCGWYSPGCVPVLADSLARAELGVFNFLEQIETVLVPITQDQKFYRNNLLFNLNTPEDWEKIRGDCSKYSGP